MHPNHLIHVTRAHTAGYRVNRLFQLIDDLPSEEREVSLETIQLEFPPESNEIASSSDRNEIYRDFRRRMIDRFSKSHEESFFVYGFVSFVLARVYFDGFVTGLRGMIDSKRQAIVETTELLKAESNPDHIEVLTRTRDFAMKAIEGLNREAEAKRRAYGSFCELVLGPLLNAEFPE